MPSEQSLLPGADLRNPPVKHEQGWDPTERHDTQEEDDQPPRGDTQVGTIESPEVHPCTDVDEAGTIQHEINNRREGFCLGLPVESAIP